MTSLHVDQQNQKAEAMCWPRPQHVLQPQMITENFMRMSGISSNQIAWHLKDHARYGYSLQGSLVFYEVQAAECLQAHAVTPKAGHEDI